MFPKPGTFPSSIRSYWYLDTIMMQKIKLLQSALYIVTNRRSIGKKNHVKLLVEAAVAKARKSKATLTAASGKATKTNTMEGIIKTTTVIYLEKVFKRG